MLARRDLWDTIAIALYNMNAMDCDSLADYIVSLTIEKNEHDKVWVELDDDDHTLIVDALLSIGEDL